MEIKQTGGSTARSGGEEQVVREVSISGAVGLCTPNQLQTHAPRKECTVIPKATTESFIKDDQKPKHKLNGPLKYIQLSQEKAGEKRKTAEASKITSKYFYQIPLN